MSKDPKQGYDAFAWFFEKYWGDFHSGVFPAIEELLLSRLPAGASVLDLCCGTGHMSRLLSDYGVKVTGTDISCEMLKFAMKALPCASFFASDARALAARGSFLGVVSTFDSINHILDPSELKCVFTGVFDSLSEGGIFVFDMLLEEAYIEDWNQTGFYVEHDNACLVSGGYDRKTRGARADITLFRLHDGWVRSDITIHERYYPAAEFMEELSNCGFKNVSFFDARRDLKMDGRFSKGRAFITAERGTP